MSLENVTIDKNSYYWMIGRLMSIAQGIAI